MRLEELFLDRMINPPTLSLDLTEEERNTCKEMTIEFFKEKYPMLAEKATRTRLTSFDKIAIINELTELYEIIQQEMVERKFA